MADRYWVGGTAAWDGTAGTKWALTSGGAGGQAVPTAADDVFLDAASGAVTVTVQTINGNAKSLNCTGFTGTLAGVGGVVVSNGNLTLGAGMGFTSTGQWQFGGTGTITSNGVVFTASITLTGTGQTVTLGDAFISTGTFAATRGTFTTSASNYSFTAARLTSTGTITRQIDLNGSTVTLSGGSTVIDISGSNFTFNAGTSTINITSVSSTLNGGNVTFNNVAYTNSSWSTVARVIQGTNTFSQLTLIESAQAEYFGQYRFDANQTITTFICSGTAGNNRIFLYSNTPGTARTLTVTTWSTIADVDFRDISLNSLRSGTRLGDAGGNTNITFPAAKTVFWNLAGTQNWRSDGWAATSGGSPATSNFPLAQDTAVFDNTGAAGTVTMRPYFVNVGTFDASSRTSAMTLTGFLNLNLYRDWTTGTGVSSTGITLNCSGRTTQTITSAGTSFSSINTNENISGTVVLADALTVLNNVSLSGATNTLDASSYNVTCGALSAASGTLALGTGTWSVTVAGNSWTVNAAATITGTAEIIMSNNSATARTFAGGGKTYGKLTAGGNTGISTLTITGTNTFSEISSTKTVAHTIVFPNVTTTVGAFTVNGSAGNVVTLSRTGASGVFTLAKSDGGTVTVDRLSISNSTASPGSTWTATNSIDGGGNTGWTITAPSLSGGNFFQFFV